jgi:hypothetical protein
MLLEVDCRGTLANHCFGQDDAGHGRHDAHFHRAGHLLELLRAFATIMAAIGHDGGGFVAPAFYSTAGYPQLNWGVAPCFLCWSG